MATTVNPKFAVVIDGKLYHATERQFNVMMHKGLYKPCRFSRVMTAVMTKPFLPHYTVGMWSGTFHADAKTTPIKGKVARGRVI